VLSVGAILLMFWLIRRGTASGFTSLYVLVPPVTLLEAWILFGEHLPVLALVGFAVATLGVALVRAPRAPIDAA
jgi:drug/metabolite transporter (DMT)-like permease